MDFAETSNPSTNTGNAPFQCDLCKKTFTSKSRFELHLQRHAGNGPLLFQCDLCTNAFSRKHSLKVHLQYHAQRSFSLKSSSDSQLPCHEKRFQCKECRRRKFARKDDNLESQIPLRAEERPLKCEICPRKSIIEDDSDVHHSEAHIKGEFKCEICQKKLRKKRSVPAEEKPFKCDVCQRKFTSESYLKYHYAYHTEKRPFHCNICKKKFENEKALRVHLPSHISFYIGKNPYHRCNICKLIFMTKDGLSGHILALHTRKNVTRAKGKAFQYNVPQKKYCRLEADAAEKQFYCKLCSLKFYSKKYLNRHLLIHRKKKTFVCRVCHEEFPKRASLRIHTKQHTVKKPSQNKKYVKKKSVSTEIESSSK